MTAAKQIHWMFRTAPSSTLSKIERRIPGEWQKILKGWQYQLEEHMPYKDQVSAQLRKRCKQD
jgi:hypothetical protein